MRTYSEDEASTLIMAALAANNDRPMEAETTDDDDVEDQAWLDGYIVGFERAALCLAKGIGHEALARKLGAQ